MHQTQPGQSQRDARNKRYNMFIQSNVVHVAGPSFLHVSAEYFQILLDEPHLPQMSPEAKTLIETMVKDMTKPAEMSS